MCGHQIIMKAIIATEIAMGKQEFCFVLFLCLFLLRKMYVLLILVKYILWNLNKVNYTFPVFHRTFWGFLERYRAIED